LPQDFYLAWPNANLFMGFAQGCVRQTAIGFIVPAAREADLPAVPIAWIFSAPDQGSMPMALFFPKGKQDTTLFGIVRRIQSFLKLFHPMGKGHPVLRFLAGQRSGQSFTKERNKGILVSHLNRKVTAFAGLLLCFLIRFI
jgi:hypothetical protein